MKTKRFLHLIACAAPAAILAGASGVWAQEAPAERDVAVDTIIVTAQKRAVDLQDVPLAVSAYTGATLEALGVQDLEQASYLAPNFVLESGATSNDTRIASRGIAAASIILGQPEAVGVFVDGVYVPGRNVANLDLLDVERVEVLRGPQGTLFGRNTTAGALNITTREPGGELAGSAAVEIGDYETTRVRASLSGPLTDALGVQIGGFVEEHRGSVYNTATGEYAGSGESGMVRAGLVLAPAEAMWSARLTGDYAADDNISGALSPRPFTRETAQENSTDNQHTSSLALTYTHDFGVANLTAITGWRSYVQKRFSDVDNTVTPGALASESGERQESEQISQELRLTSKNSGRFTWLAGVYASREDINQDTVLTLAQVFPVFGAYTARTRFEQTNDNWAVFAQGTYSLTERLHLTAGLRHSSDDKDTTSTTIGEIPGLLTPGVSTRTTGDSATTPLLNVRYEFTPDISGYLSYAEGYKEGAVNSRELTGNLAAFQVIEPERAVNYEAGLKSILFEDRLRLNVAVFYIDYEKLQVQVDDPAATVRLIRNAPEAHSQGVEVEWNARLTDAISLDGSIGYADAKYDDFDNCASSGFGASSFAISCDGNTLANAPDLTGSLSVRVNQPLTETYALTGGISYNYRGVTYFSSDNRDALRRPAYELVDADIGVAHSKGWALTAWVKNLLDEDYASIISEGSPTVYRSTDADQLILSIAGKPQTFGARLSAKF